MTHPMDREAMAATEGAVDAVMDRAAADAVAPVRHLLGGDSPPINLPTSQELRELLAREIRKRSPDGAIPPRLDGLLDELVPILMGPIDEARRILVATRVLPGPKCPTEIG